MWRVYLLSGVIACVAGATTAFITVHLTKPSEPPNATIALEGEEYLPGSEEKVVYYKTPFASPPYLSGTGMETYKITEQKAESFKLQRPPGVTSQVKLKWKAEGQPAN